MVATKVFQGVFFFPKVADLTFFVWIDAELPMAYVTPILKEGYCYPTVAEIVELNEQIIAYTAERDVAIDGDAIEIRSGVTQAHFEAFLGGEIGDYL